MKINYSILMILFSVVFLVQSTTSVDDEVKTSLINFVTKLSAGGGIKPGSLLGWNSSSDPCEDRWRGVVCGAKNRSVRKLFLNSSNLAGELDIRFLCNTKSLSASLAVLHLENNSLAGELSAAVSSCRRLTHLHLNSNRLSGGLPTSLSALNNLKTLDVSSNDFSGALPDLSGISGLAVLLAQNNRFTGEAPRLDFSRLRLFNVSNNLLTGRVPDVRGHFHANSFLGNPSLCGDPTPNECPSSRPEDFLGESRDSSDDSTKNQIIMFGGYIVLGIVVAVMIVLLFLRKRKKKVEPSKNEAGSGSGSGSGSDLGPYSSYNSGFGQSGISGESCSLVVVSSSGTEVGGLRLEELLKAPAEILGRGVNGSLYKVRLSGGKRVVVVKRIKNWAISSHEFKKKMERLHQLKHRHVLPTLAFYSSKQEKLLVYEFQPNGSLFKILHGTNTGQEFDWTTRLSIAWSIAGALAFMHHELRDDEIPHGNLKSSNIFLNDDMEPCVSEYGLMGSSTFKDDVYGFGVILLELLTGNLAKHNGVELTDWVRSVVREEWTGEVFDKALLSECASEERMVSLLQVAIKCVNRPPEARPAMSQVVAMISAIKEEEDRSAMASGP